MALEREQTGALLELYFEAEERIIEDMARRIAAYDYFIPAAQHQMKSLEQMGKCREDIYRQLSELTGRSESELAAMLRQAVADNLAIDREIYKANNLDADAAMGSADIAGELKAGFEQTNGTLRNITGTTARLGAVQFQNELDNAWMMVSSGAFSPDEAVRQAVNRLADSGVKAVKYDSGRTLSLEAAVSMCVATGAAQTAAKSRIVLAGEVGCDLVEVTAHAGARPEHAEWQGSICSLSGKSRKYPSLREHTGYGTVTGLCGANCAHSFFPWFEGSSRNWTEDELAKLSEPKYEWGGKKLTEYEATQVQRGIERNIRAYKRRVVGLEAAGQYSTAAAAKVREWQSRQREFLAATGLKRKSAREQVAGTLGLQKSSVKGIIQLTTDERRALNEYISSGSYKINEVLRKGASLKGEQVQFVAQLDAALSKMPIYEGVVYRSITDFGIENIDDFWNNYAFGKNVKFLSYTSCGTEVYDDSFPIQYIIKTKNGRDIRGLNQNEQEILFPRGTTFKVVKVENGTIYLEDSE